MRVRVQFRVDAETGEVEVFQIDDLGSTLPAGEHEETHDRIAAEIGRVVERRPRVEEVDGQPAHTRGYRPVIVAPADEAGEREQPRREQERG